MSTATTKAKWREPAYSHTLKTKTKSTCGSQDPESEAGSKTAMVDGT